MALANGLSAVGHPPQSLRTNARIQLRNVDGAVTLARIDLETDGDVPGIDERQFQAYAEAAKWDCPVSRALAGIPEIILTAKLLTADPVDAPARSDR
jgi:osmotically inducible protein OsmC